MRVLQGYNVLSENLSTETFDFARMVATHFLNFTSATRSRPPLTLSARKTLPVGRSRLYVSAR